MASGDLSVALVIDTASGLTPQELAAAQNGATEFLLRLPGGARTMVVTAGGKPEVVAPLSEHRAEALSAISALRVGGSRATMPAAMHAAQSLESAPPGPRAIIVYTHGPDEQGMLPDRLSQAVLHLRSGRQRHTDRTDALWPSVVQQAGGVVVTTNAGNIVQSFGDLAATLDDQYLVTFEAPGELPAVAQVAFQTGDQEYTTVINLPDAGQAQAAPTESSEGPPARGVALAGRALGRRARVDNARCAPSPRPSAATCVRRRTIHRDGQPTDRRSATGQGCRRDAARFRKQLPLGMPRCPSWPPRALHPQPRLHRARQHGHRPHRKPHRPSKRPCQPLRCPTTLRRTTHRGGHLPRRRHLSRHVNPCQLLSRVGDWLGSSWTRSRSYGQNPSSSMVKPTTIKPRTHPPTCRRATRPKPTAPRPGAKLVPKRKAGGQEIPPKAARHPQPASCSPAQATASCS